MLEVLLKADWVLFKVKHIYLLIYTLKPGLGQICIKSILITTVLCKEIYVRGYELFLPPSRCILFRQIHWFPVKTLLFCTYYLHWYDPVFLPAFLHTMFTLSSDYWTNYRKNEFSSGTKLKTFPSGCQRGYEPGERSYMNIKLSHWGWTTATVQRTSDCVPIYAPQ